MEAPDKAEGAKIYRLKLGLSCETLYKVQYSFYLFHTCSTKHTPRWERDGVVVERPSRNREVLGSVSTSVTMLCP